MSKQNSSDQVHRHANRKSGWIALIDIGVAAIVVAALLYVYIWNIDPVLKAAVGVLLAIAIIAYAARRSGSREAGRQDEVDTIAKLVLLNDEGESVKEWYIHGETSLLIGKTGAEGEVDIDLSDSEYASLISKHHAVLNYASGQWFIEDLDSRSGVGIRRAGGKRANQLEPEEPCRIHSGDVISIANTRLLAK